MFPGKKLLISLIILITNAFGFARMNPTEKNASGGCQSCTNGLDFAKEELSSRRWADGYFGDACVCSVGAGQDGDGGEDGGEILGFGYFLLGITGR